MVSLIVAFLVLYSFFIIKQLCSATDEDIISHNKILRDGETIVSNGGIYALGFFSPGKSKLRYVGIWYKKIPKQTVVWVANRNNPIINTSSSGVAKVDERGNLGIFNGINASTPVWSTNISIPANSDKTTSLFYKLLDSGNLVLRDGESINKGDFLWQSFDFPTDTRLPEMKIGFNLKSGMNWSLTSWKSRDDPSTGDFTYSMDRTGMPEISIKKGQQKIWRTGPWNGQGWNGIPADTVSTSSFVNGRDGTYTIGHNTSLPFRLYMDESGIARRAMWFQGEWTVVWSAPQESCDNYGKCGAFGICSISNNAPICSCLPGYEPKSPTDLYLKNGSHGCVRKRELFCGKGDGGFLKLARMKLPDTSNTRVEMSLGIKDCEIECRNNCSCTGYTSADVNGSGCIAWFGDLTDIREFTLDKGGQDLFVRVDAIELEVSKTHSKGSFTKKKLVLLCVSIVVGLLTLIFTFYYMFKRAKRRGLARKERVRELLFELPSSNTNEVANGTFELPIFDLHSIMIATNNLSPTNKLGSGGFGSVYKGKLSDGREIAVKRLSKNSGQGVIEFKNEVVLIAKLQHRNLVQILGCCVEEEEKMLVYEFMPNKSLDFLLFDPTRSTSLDWGLRRDIILGIARGVLYLHQDSRLRIIHRDLKASNVLLDAEMNPKISDFGMARIFGGNQTQGNTNRVVGTFGYMSPEYAMDGLFSTKSDVFSFGVLSLEIISGKKNTGFYCEDPLMNLIKHAWELWRDGRPLELVDSAIGTSVPEQEVVKFIQVGILCVQEKANDRPTMSSAFLMLSNETTIPNPAEPAFILPRNLNHPNSSSSISANEMSTTIVEGR
ncbi:hypothetical protein Scep_028622 [Stephania cephalantha]|uniref:Receptor-like serine/threonine-protein kinase n=1 Tax=Stephania cephalantha TaxID=152367 RepID=A0AAP0ECD5_9MAGN